MNMETPRTDKAVKESNGQWSYALVDTCKQLERELAAANQIMGELCESCGWAMRFPDQPCRCELERELAEAREQRDALAEALNRWPEIREWLEMSKYIFGYMQAEKKFFDQLSEALAAVKGGSDE